MSPVPSPSHAARKERRVWKTQTFAPHNDGYQWRKYGEKKINNSKFPRYYYRCTYKDNMNCPATKQFQQKDRNDPPMYSVTYYNEHSCNNAAAPVAATDFQARSSAGKEVSICFDSYGTQELKSPCSWAGSASCSAVTRSVCSGDAGSGETSAAGESGSSITYYHFL